MPTETRHICFDLHEVVEALLDMRRRSGKSVPAGDIVHRALDYDAPSKHVRFTMGFAREDGKTETMVAGQAELGAALIYFCRQTKIPLPIRASKSVGIIDGKVVLICIRSQKDFVPMEIEIPSLADPAASDEPPPEVEHPATVSDDQKRVLRLENARRRLRRGALA